MGGEPAQHTMLRSNLQISYNGLKGIAKLVWQSALRDLECAPLG